MPFLVCQAPARIKRKRSKGGKRTRGFITGAFKLALVAGPAIATKGTTLFLSLSAAKDVGDVVMAPEIQEKVFPLRDGQVKIEQHIRDQRAALRNLIASDLQQKWLSDFWEGFDDGWSMGMRTKMSGASTTSQRCLSSSAASAGCRSCKCRSTVAPVTAVQSAVTACHWVSYRPQQRTDNSLIRLLCVLYRIVRQLCTVVHSRFLCRIFL